MSRTTVLSVVGIVAVWAMLSSRERAGAAIGTTLTTTAETASPFAPPWRHLALECAGRRKQGLERKAAAIAVAVCNGTDHMQQGGQVQLERAAALAASIRASRAGAGAVLVAVLHGFDERSTGVAGFDRHVFVHRELRFATKLPPRSASPYRDTVWPEDLPSSRSAQYLRKLQRRTDGPCTSLKFDFWNLTEYTTVLALDTDVKLSESPRPFLERVAASDVEFAATREDRYVTGLRGARRSAAAVNATLQVLHPKLTCRTSRFRGCVNLAKSNFIARVHLDFRSEPSQRSAAAVPGRQHSR